MQNQKKTKSFSYSGTYKIGHDLAISVNGPLLVGLSGELGVGKTVFVQGFAEGLGVKELITSPTFLGISEYYSGKVPFIHMDFYKKVLSKEKIDKYLKDKTIVLIEWIDNFNQLFKTELLLPDININIQYLRDKDKNIIENERQITIQVK